MYTGTISSLESHVCWSHVQWRVMCVSHLFSGEPRMLVSHLLVESHIILQSFVQWRAKYARTIGSIEPRMLESHVC